MNWDVVITCAFIIVARIADVSLGTLRTVFVIAGRKYLSWLIGFVEVLIWVVVVGKVITNIGDNPLYPVAYAFGFAMGTFVGLTIEEHLAMGRQVVRIFSRNGTEMAKKLREAGYWVTSFTGDGRDGPVQLLFIETSRRKVRPLARLSHAIDPKSFYVVDDIRFAGPLQAPGQTTTGWRNIIKRK